MSVADFHNLVCENNSRLGGKLFLGGPVPGPEDTELFKKLFGDNNHLARWVKHMASFTPEEIKAWGAPVKVTAPPLGPIPQRSPAAASAASIERKQSPTKSTGAKQSPRGSPKSSPAKPAAKPSSTAAPEDDVDLFGEETEEDKAALEAKKAKDAEKKKAKKDVIAKSSILMDIKPWDDTTDLAELQKKLHAVKKDGLVWGDFKLVPIAFGIKKLQQLIVIEDEKVSGEDLDDMIVEDFKDYVQSMDIVAWNKI